MKQWFLAGAFILIAASGIAFMGGFIFNQAQYMLAAIYWFIVGAFIHGVVTKWPDPPKKEEKNVFTWRDLW